MARSTEVTRLQSGDEDTPVFACRSGYRANSENYRSGTRTQSSGGQVSTKWRMPLVLTLPTSRKSMLSGVLHRVDLEKGRKVEHSIVDISVEHGAKNYVPDADAWMLLAAGGGKIGEIISCYAPKK